MVVITGTVTGLGWPVIAALGTCPRTYMTPWAASGAQYEEQGNVIRLVTTEGCAAPNV